MSKKRKKGTAYRKRRKAFLLTHRKKDGWYCTDCQTMIKNISDVSIEHVIPICYGIVHQFDETNWKILCKKCNSSGERNVLQSRIFNLQYGLYEFCYKSVHDYLLFENQLVEKIGYCFVETATYGNSIYHFGWKQVIRIE